MKITRQLFIEETGESPEALLPDEELNEEGMRAYLEDCDYICSNCGCTPTTGACYYCKMD